MIDWKSCDSNPPAASGMYLVTVKSDSDKEVHVLEYQSMRKNWIHEGEPTYCHGYEFRPVFWDFAPEPCQETPEEEE